MLDGLRLPAASIALVALLAASVVDGLPVSEQSPLHPRAVPFTDVETSRTIPLALPGVLVGTAPAWQPVLQGAPNPPAPLQFRCPSTTTTQSVPDPRKDPTADRVEYGCPFRIYDQSPQIDPAGRPRTGFHFGNPQIVVNPSDEREIAFASLHGEPQQDGPTPRSRTGLPQTTFTTKDQGITWEDQYMNAVPAGGGQLGESDAITMDSHGNLYVGYLWSSANGNESTGYSSAIGLYKAATTHDAATVMQSYGNPFVYQSRTDRNPIDRLHLVYVAPYQPPPPTLSNETGNQTGAEAPASDDQVGQVTKSTNRSDERIVAVWHERAIDYRNSTTGYSAWIDAAVTTSQAKND